MSSADDVVRPPGLTAPEEQRALNDQWRSLRRSATVVAVLCAPAAFVWLWQVEDVSFGWTLVATAVAVFAFRGLLDLIFWRFIPRPEHVRARTTERTARGGRASPPPPLVLALDLPRLCWRSRSSSRSSSSSS
jgi:hypothetical protein